MITVTTVNVKGLATSKKLDATLNLLKSYSFIDIFTLQKTNMHEDFISSAKIK